MTCTEAYKEHIMYTYYGFCKVVIRNATITAWCDQHRQRKREISLEYLTEEKFYPLSTSDEYFTEPYEEYPNYNLRSDNHSHQWETCRRPALPAGKEPGNHFPLFFRALQTVGDWGNVRTLPEYNRVSNPKDIEASAGRNGGAFTWGIRTLSLMKRLYGRQRASRKRWTRFYSITAGESAMPPLKTDTENSIKSRLVAVLFKFRFDGQAT